MADIKTVLMTEGELVEFLRIPEVSKAKNYHNVINNSTVISSPTLFRAKGRHFLLATPC